MNKFNIKNAVELKKLGYYYYEDDGFSEFLKATNVPDKLNTEYIDFKKISFNRLEREVSIYRYRKNATCTEFLEMASNTNISYLNNEELQAIFKICKELGWNNE